jgi:hypothetical protein
MQPTVSLALPFQPDTSGLTPADEEAVEAFRATGPVEVIDHHSFQPTSHAFVRGVVSTDPRGIVSGWK